MRFGPAWWLAVVLGGCGGPSSAEKPRDTADAAGGDAAVADVGDHDAAADGWTTDAGVDEFALLPACRFLTNLLSVCIAQPDAGSSAAPRLDVSGTFAIDTAPSSSTLVGCLVGDAPHYLTIVASDGEASHLVYTATDEGMDLTPSLASIVGSTVTVHARSWNQGGLGSFHELTIFDNDGLVLALHSSNGGQSVDSYALPDTDLQVKPGRALCKMQHCGSVARELVFTAQSEVVLPPGSADTLTLGKHVYEVNALRAQDHGNTCSDGWAWEAWTLVRDGI